MGQKWRICDLNSLHKIPNQGGSTLAELFLGLQYTPLQQLLEGDLFSMRTYEPLGLHESDHPQEWYRFHSYHVIALALF